MKYKVKISNFVFGVPKSLLGYKYNPEQFEIVNSLNRYPLIEEPGFINPPGTFATAINGVPQYARVLIRRRSR